MNIFHLLFLIMFSVIPGESDYLSGWTAERNGDYETALSYYVICSEEPGPLVPYALIRTAQCNAEMGNIDRAIEDLQSILKAHPDGPWVEMVNLEMAVLYMQMDKHKEAADLFENVLSADYKPWWFAEYDWMAAENLLAEPDSMEKGLDFFRNVVENTRFRYQRLNASRLLMKSENPDDQFMAAMGLVRSRSYKEASKALLTLGTKVLKDRTLTADWQALAAQILMGIGQDEQGREMMEGISKEFEGTKWERFALYHAARNLISKKKTSQARMICDRLVKKFPESTETGDSLWRLAQNLDVNGHKVKAITEYLRLVRVTPNHSRVDDSLFHASQAMVRLNERTRALELLNTIIERHSRGAFYSDACYWAGRILESNGQIDEATGLFQKASKNNMGDFYAHRSIERLYRLGAIKGEPGRRLKAGRKTYYLRSSHVPNSSGPSIEMAMGTSRFELLSFFGSYGMHEGEWEALDILHKGTSPVPYRTLSEAGMAYSSMKHAKLKGWGRDKNNRPTTDLLYINYPRTYWKEVLKIAHETDIDPYLILSIALRESTFRPAIMSNAGATGTMQVMPTTASWLADVDPAIDKTHANNLDVPIYSLRIGAYYLKRMLKRSDGNIVYALASYNAGPGNLDKWKNSLPSDDLDYFIEAIPYTETRDYIKAVLGNYAAYHSLYPPVNLE